MRKSGCRLTAVRQIGATSLCRQTNSSSPSERPGRYGAGAADRKWSGGDRARTGTDHHPGRHRGLRHVERSSSVGRTQPTASNGPRSPPMNAGDAILSRSLRPCGEIRRLRTGHRGTTAIRGWRRSGRMRATRSQVLHGQASGRTGACANSPHTRTRDHGGRRAPRVRQRPDPPRTGHTTSTAARPHCAEPPRTVVPRDYRCRRRSLAAPSRMHRDPKAQPLPLRAPTRTASHGPVDLPLGGTRRRRLELRDEPFSLPAPARRRSSTNNTRTRPSIPP